QALQGGARLVKPGILTQVGTTHRADVDAGVVVETGKQHQPRHTVSEGRVVFRMRHVGSGMRSAGGLAHQEDAVGINTVLATCMAQVTKDLVDVLESRRPGVLGCKAVGHDHGVAAVAYGPDTDVAVERVTFRAFVPGY